MNKKYLAVTSFNKEGYECYGKEMITSFLKFWDKDINLVVYTENFISDIIDPRITYIDLENSSPELVNFKKKYSNVDWANGKATPPDEILSNMKIKIFTLKSKIKIGHGYRYCAVKFSHKVFAIQAAYAAFSKTVDYLIWLDGDVITENQVNDELLSKVIFSECCTSYLGRHDNHTECGFVAYNCNHLYIDEFMNKYKQYYINDSLFILYEWHDCYPYDVIRINSASIGVKHFNITTTSKKNKGHVFETSILGKYMNHKKGDRKYE